MSDTSYTAAGRQSSGATALDKKRARDRRAQRSARERREKQTKDYEAQLDFCKRYHSGPSMDGEHTSQSPAIQQELQRMREQQNQMVKFVEGMRRNIEDLLYALQGGNVSMTHDSAIGMDDSLPMPATTIPAQQPESLETPVWVDPAHVAADTPGTHSRRWTIADMLCPADLGTATAPVPDNNMHADSLYQLYGAKPTPRQMLPVPSTYTDDSAVIIDLDESYPLAQRSTSEDVTAQGYSYWGSEVSDMRPTLSRSQSLVSPRHTVTSSRSIDSVPRWARVPLNINLHSEEIMTYYKTPEIVTESPDEPDPVDLVFGSRKNRLAGAIHARLRRYRVGEPERLAFGWIIYVYMKWRLGPSRERYERVPAFFRPTDQQLEFEHPPECDAVIWPAVRNRMIQVAGKDDWEEVIDMLACCIKIRWPWGKEILEPNDRGGFRICADFFQSFTSINGWGLTREFIQKHAELVTDLDLDSVTYTIQVPS